MMQRLAALFVLLLCAGTVSAAAAAPPAGGDAGTAALHQWSAQEKETLRSLWIGSLPPLPKDPSNRFEDDPRAVSFGKKLFFDEKFSANGKVSCASCHRPGYGFTDDLPVAKGMGFTTRRTMPLIGAAYQSWFFWDGRKDSLWSQAIGPIESSVEHGITRAQCAHLISGRYRKEYTGIFGKLPHITHKSCPPEASPATGNPDALKAWNAMKPEDREAVNRIYANIGKAIAAYVRKIVPSPSRFDRYAEAVLREDLPRASRLFSPQEVRGLRLFVGRAKCTNCHAGPLFTNSGFHSVGVGLSDRGRAEGIGKVLDDEFNCLGRYSDAAEGDCAELRFIDNNPAKYEAAMKTPSLRGVADRPPYMHAGQFRSLREVLVFYQKEATGRDIEHRDLSDQDIGDLEAFLRTLSSPLKSP
ncbi:MAG: cytochrome c peroxidase [Thermodesulfovibrionales bacterium]